MEEGDQAAARGAPAPARQALHQPARAAPPVVGIVDVVDEDGRLAIPLFGTAGERVGENFREGAGGALEGARREIRARRRSPLPRLARGNEERRRRAGRRQGPRQGDGVVADAIGRRRQAGHDLQQPHRASALRAGRSGRAAGREGASPAMARIAASASSGVASDSRSPASLPRLTEVSGYPHCA